MEHAMENLSLQDQQATVALILSLPLDLYPTIFEYVLPPAFLLDPSISRGSNSAWCWSIRMKKSIILVCKTWYNIATPWLYHNVVLRRCTQIPALLRSLQFKPELGALVKHIHVNCYIPRPMVKICLESMEKIYQSCTQLVSLDLVDLVFILAEYRHNPNPITTILIPSPETLLTFSCDVDVIPSFPNAYWNKLRNSVTELHLVIKDDFDFQSLTDKSLEFPNVTSFRCYIRRRQKVERKLKFQSFPKNLQTPSLYRLSVGTDYEYIITRDAANDWRILTNLLEICGSKLRYLNIGALKPEYLDLSLCPLLEHLVIAKHFKLTLAPCIHENLQVIDTFEYEIPDIITQFSNVDWTNLPNVKILRRMDPASWVYNLPPNSTMANLAYDIIYPGIEWGYQLVEVVYSKNTGWREESDLNENLHPFTGYVDFSDESDPKEPDEEYMDDSDEDYDTEVREVEEEMKDAFFDAEGDSHDWQMDYATALEIHAQNNDSEDHDQYSSDSD